MRWPYTVLFLFLASSFSAQTTEMLVNDNRDRLIWQANFDIHDQEFHSVFRGYSLRESPVDTSVFGKGLAINKEFIRPISSLGAEIGFDEGESLFSSHALLGVSLAKDLSKSFHFQGALYGGLTDGDQLTGIRPATEGIYSGIGEFSEVNGRTASIWDGLFALRFSPSHIFSAEVGRKKHFWGDGYRSLFLSDNAAAYPYLKLQTKVWHLNYTNLFSWQQGMFDINASNPQFEDKFTSTHMLSWNVSPSFNIQVFESIIWQGEDSLSQRGFDVSYLNPIIFYRPVEFASGSADNAIIGMGMSLKVYPSYLLYMQLAFDEFLLSEFRARNGWWGNKYGIQVGVKGFDAFGVEGLYFQSELNLVRPFTYSHGSPLQNYAHLSEPLSHPLGANFYEGLIIAAYDWRGLEFRNQTSYILKGDDIDDMNLGGDIFRSYVDPERIQGNFIGQGMRTEALQNSLYVSKVFDRQTDTRLMLGYHTRADMGDIEGIAHVFSLSLKSNFGDGFR